MSSGAGTACSSRGVGRDVSGVRAASGFDFEGLRRGVDVGVVQGISELDDPASSRSDLRSEEMAAVVVVLDGDDRKRDGLQGRVLNQDGESRVLGVGVAGPGHSVLRAVHPPQRGAGLGDGELGDGRGSEKESGCEVREHGW